MALAASPGIGAEAISAGSAITSDGLTRRSLATPAGSRWIGVISAPDSVVGTAAQLRPSAHAIALAESITRPPPSATRSRPSTAVRTAAAATGTSPGGTSSTTPAPSARSGADSSARSVVSSAYASKPRSPSSTAASPSEPGAKRMRRSPSTQVKSPRTRPRLRGGCSDRLFEVVLGLGHGRVLDRARERAQVRATGCLEDVRGHARARHGLAVVLDQHRHLAERIAPSGDRADVVLLQPRLVAGGGVQRAEERVDRPVAREAALGDLTVGHPHAGRGERGARGRRLHVEGLEHERQGLLAHLVGDDRLEVERRDLLLLVRERLEALEGVVQRGAVDLEAQLLQRVAQGVAAGVLAEHQ